MNKKNVILLLLLVTTLDVMHCAYYTLSRERKRTVLHENLSYILDLFYIDGRRRRIHFSHTKRKINWTVFAFYVLRFFFFMRYHCIALHIAPHCHTLLLIDTVVYSGSLSYFTWNTKDVSKSLFAFFLFFFFSFKNLKRWKIELENNCCCCWQKKRVSIKQIWQRHFSVCKYFWCQNRIFTFISHMLFMFEIYAIA